MQKVDISFTSWLRLLLVGIGLAVLWQVRDVVSLLFVAFILVQALRPVVKQLTDTGIPRGVSIAITYLVLVGGFVAALSLVVPSLVTQLGLLAANLPLLLAKAKILYATLPASVDLQQFITSITNQLGLLTGNVLTVATQLFGGVISLTTVLVLSFYLLLDERQLDAVIHMAFPSRLTGPVRQLLDKIGMKMGGWVRGQVMLSGIVGLLTLIVLSILQVPYALTLAVLAAILEVLPIIGPLVTAIFGALLALTSGSWGLALATVIAFALIQQAESSFIVPKVMQKAVGLSPVVVIVALLIGGALAGIPGAILAVPIASGIDVLVDEWGSLRDAFEQGKA